MRNMKAFVKESDRPDDLRFAEMPIPEPGEHELLVRVKAVGVGIHDGYFLPRDMHYPYPIGIEAAGVVERAGDGVSAFRAGERIAFVSMMQPKGGTWAEYAVVSEDSLILRIPERMSFEEAAAVPVAGNTVLKALGPLQLRAGLALFIAGASGAIGTLAIQLAKKEGCRVAGSASAKNHAYMKSLGADFTVDYRDPGWQRQIIGWSAGGADAALAIQPGTANDCLPVVRDGGRIVPVSGDQVPSAGGVRVVPFPYQADVRSRLSDMMDDIAEGRLHLEIEQIYPFAEGLEALRKTQTRHARGKLVLTMEP
ncbi:NADP-dependent oxidoreductase [Bhargavaea ullalensis]|uniref:NADPH:quinone reductase-like Zn-dependent oxidoreductase n=1 Tax=Bhargavaea ullalensis TaxID=1265685 RepID=A0ABV2GA05_9BACL